MSNFLEKSCLDIALGYLASQSHKVEKRLRIFVIGFVSC